MNQSWSIYSRFNYFYDRLLYDSLAKHSHQESIAWANLSREVVNIINSPDLILTKHLLGKQKKTFLKD